MPRNAAFILAVRLCLTVLAVVVGVLVFGPFGGVETQFGLTDKEGHALAFYALEALALPAAPRMRKWDVAVVLIVAGGLIEVVQTFVGRDGDVLDWLADIAGVLLAVIPMILQSLRTTAIHGRLGQIVKRRRSDRAAAHRKASATSPTEAPISN